MVPDLGETIGLSAARFSEFGPFSRSLGATTNRHGSLVGGRASPAIIGDRMYLELGRRPSGTGWTAVDGGR